jgi:UDP-N-acetylglucosamine 3-dehydrogenase
MAAHKILLFGLGNMGKNHFRVINESPEADIIGIVDPFLKADSIKGLQIPVYSKLSEVKENSFDAAVIASSTETHFDVAKTLLEMGKSLLVEKPLASTYKQSLELASLAEQKKSLLVVGHVERSNPAVKKVKEVLENGWLGNPIHFSFTRVGGYPQNVKSGNNVLLDLAVHDMDVLHYLSGEFQVKASICHHSIQNEIPDTAEILLSSPKGPSASIHVNWITPTKIRTLRVTGTKGVCFVDYMLQTCTLLGGNLLQKAPQKNFDYKDLQLHYRNSDKIEFGVAQEEPLKVQLKEFIKALKGEKHALCTAREAAEVVRLAEDAIKQTGNT